MSKKVACKKCKFLYEGTECPACKAAQPVTNWKGRIYITDVENSGIGKKVGVDKEGEYAIKVG